MRRNLLLCALFILCIAILGVVYYLSLPRETVEEEEMRIMNEEQMKSLEKHREDWNVHWKTKDALLEIEKVCGEGDLGYGEEASKECPAALLELDKVKKARMGFSIYNRTFHHHPLSHYFDMKRATQLSQSYHWNVTIILNVFHRKSLCNQLHAWISQEPAPPLEIWVMAWKSDLADHFHKVVQAFQAMARSRGIRLHWMEGDYNFRYYGRFQLALQARSKYVLVSDDDMIPGKKYLGILHSVAANGPRGIYGSIGWVYPFVNDTGVQDNYRSGGLYLRDPNKCIEVEYLLPVDCICSLWFLERDWIGQLWNVPPSTHRTGEDFTLSHVVRRQLGFGSYVVPVDVDDIHTYGDTTHDLSEGGTTTTRMLEMRYPIVWRHIRKGSYFQRAAVMHGDLRRELGSLPFTPFSGIRLYSTGEKYRPKKYRALFYVNSAADLAGYIPILIDVAGYTYYEVYMVYTGQDSCEQLIKEVHERYDGPYIYLTHLCHIQTYGFFDLEVGKHVMYPENVSDAIVFREMRVGLEQVREVLKPSLLIYREDIESRKHQFAKRTMEEAGVPTLGVHVGQKGLAEWKMRLKPEKRGGLDDVSFTIVLLTGTEGGNVKRTLESVMGAYYMGERVDISIHIHSEMSEADRRYCETFPWPHGTKGLQMNDGLLELRSSKLWYPVGDEERGIFLTDDMVVSPYFYAMVHRRDLRTIHLKDSAGFVFGIAPGPSALYPTFKGTVYEGRSWRRHISWEENEMKIRGSQGEDWGHNKERGMHALKQTIEDARESIDGLYYAHYQGEKLVQWEQWMRSLG